MNNFDIADSFSDERLEPPCTQDDAYFQCSICKESYHENDPRWHLVCPSLALQKPINQEQWMCSPDCAAQWEDENIDIIIEHYRELSEREVTCCKKG